ncbi:MAG: hypothetical protein Q8M07_14680 [Prosthecobacter sp.]|nr:hypothetical protein [Prosthecobacter sp.]
MRALFPLLLLLSTQAFAASYDQPRGALEIFVPGHNVTVSIFAVQTPVGHGIGILERRSEGWYLCGRCLITPELPTLAAAVKAAGGPERYVASKREDINAILALQYPANSERRLDTSVESINKALTATSTLRLINGVPQLGPR